MIDFQSILGYSNGSPYAGNPYLDINTPNGLIDMSNTPIDLIGVDNKGNKKKMKAGRKNPYKFAGEIVREFPMQTGGFFTSQQQIVDANEAERAKLRGKNVDPWLANNTVVGRRVGDPIPQYEYPQGMPQPQAPRATSLPFGVTIDKVINTQEGYGYEHPQNGNFVLVDPQAIYNKYGQKPQVQGVPLNSMASNSRNPYQKGGAIQDLYKYIMSDDGEDYGEDYADTKNTAPTEEDIEQKTIPQQESDDYEMALQMAMSQDEHQVTMGNPNWGAGRNPYITPTTSTGDSSFDNPAKYAYEFFQGKGLPAHISAGIVGNLIQESGNFRPDVITDDITGDSGMSHGIAQWQKERWPAFLGWAASTGKNPKNLDTQLEYVYHEANQRGDLQKTMSAKTPEEAATIFAKNYERPAHVDRHRINYAREVYQQ